MIINKNKSIYAILLVCVVLVFTQSGNFVFAGEAKPQAPEAGGIKGKVTEHINAGGYTYVEVQSGAKKVWAAGPTTNVKKGDIIAFSTGMPIENFHSKALERDFSLIYFAPRLITSATASGNKAAASASAHSKLKQHPNKPVKGISKLENGYSINEIYLAKQNLKGKTIRLRGKVTKYTPEVMGKNWLHLRDSSTLKDLTVTTNSTAKIGDVVIIEGKLELDKDYSYGYVYPLILVEASLKKE